MTASLPGPDWTAEEIDLAERLGLEARERITSRIGRGTPLLDSVKIEADYIAVAWAHHRTKVQIRAIQMAFEELYRRYPKEPD